MEKRITIAETETQSRPVEHLDLYQVHAIEKEKLPSNWRIFRLEAFPQSGRGDCIYIAATGAVCEQYLKGKRKGDTNWRKRDARTEVTVNLTVTEHNAWKLEWEKRTGMCSNCTGTGEVMESWNVKTGTKYRTCPKCKGAPLEPNESSSPTAADGNGGAERKKGAAVGRTRWCNHIRLLDDMPYIRPGQSYHFCISFHGEQYFVPRRWTMCPICGVTRPPNTELSDRRRAVLTPAQKRYE